MSKPRFSQPWLRNAAYDSFWILSPPFLALLMLPLLPPSLRSGDGMPLAAWVLLVLCVDVAHVYSTLYRTYFDRARFRRQRRLFTVVPVLCLVAGMVLYAVGSWLFWRVLAYTAVWHFVRQQYGFVRLYSRQETASRAARRLDALAIYSATVYPLLHWHLTGARHFNWFVPGDFLPVQAPALLPLLTGCYGLILAAYGVKEVVYRLRGRPLNLPRNAVILGTALSWYIGIVVFNGDLVFTLLNVVAHGIPYVALIWLHQPKPATSARPRPRWIGLAAFLAVIVALAYLEEGIWDGLVWREHGQAFSLFWSLPTVESPLLLNVLVPLLSLPQATHYVLDGFIWRRDA